MARMREEKAERHAVYPFPRTAGRLEATTQTEISVPTFFSRLRQWAHRFFWDYWIEFVLETLETQTLDYFNKNEQLCL